VDEILGGDEALEGARRSMLRNMVQPPADWEIKNLEYEQGREKNRSKKKGSLKEQFSTLR